MTTWWTSFTPDLPALSSATGTNETAGIFSAPATRPSYFLVWDWVTGLNRATIPATADA